MSLPAQKPDVNTPNAQYECMVEAAELPRTLMGGTVAMRAAGTKYLPQEPNEEDAAYRNRRDRSFLYNAYGRAVRSLTGKLFSKGLKLEKVPKDLEDLCNDIDLGGRDLTRFVRDVFEDAWQPGLAFILIDCPSAELDADGNPVQESVEDQKNKNKRPWWIHVRQENVINWEITSVNGVETLTRVQIREVDQVPDGEWGFAAVEQVRVLYPGRWEIHQQDPTTKEWKVVRRGTTSIDFIALVPVYTGRTACMCARPPLEDLAWTNALHWQSSSDQRHILHIARVPILFGAGFATETTAQTISVSRMIKNSDPNAKLSYVEHTGKAIEAGRVDLQDIEDRMTVLAMEPLMPRTGNTTATAKAIDTAEAASALECMAGDLEDCIELALQYTDRWMSGTGENIGSVEVDYDFKLSMQDAKVMDVLIAARKGKDISRIAFLAELQRREILSEEYNAEADQALLDAEAPTLGEIGGGVVDEPGKQVQE